MTVAEDPIFVAHKFAQADWRLASLQLFNTLVPFIISWGLAAYSLNQWPFLTPLFCFLATGFYIRIFSIFHDCGHRAFTPNQKVNLILGFLLGVLFFIPYHHWVEAHSKHHTHAGNLDRRGVGDVWTLTLAEYRAASGFTKLSYRFYRSPLGMFISTMIIGFIVVFRFPQIGATSAARRGIWATNVALIVQWGSLSVCLGFATTLVVQGSIYLIGTAVGMLLIYVDHTFEGIYWVRDNKWNFRRVAMEGSSFLALK